MKTATSVCLVACMILALAACGGANNSSNSSGGGGGGGPDYSTPQASMKTLADAMASGDIDRILACYTKKEQDGKRGEFEGMKKDGMTVRIEYKEADIKVDGDKAEVKALMYFKTKDGKEEEENEKFNMVKEDGLWKHE